MANIEKVSPVKLFCGILYKDSAVLNDALNLLYTKLGEIDFQSKEFDFSITSYYEQEMGASLKRIFISFTELITPDKISDLKVFTNEIENNFIKDGMRMINLDPGYIDYMKLILASAKYGPHKIYLTNGIYADLTLIYSKGTFINFPWTFPDFKSDLYKKELIEIRNIYKEQMK